MNALDLRHRIARALDSPHVDDIENSEYVSPIPGQPVQLLITTTDTTPGKTRTFRLSITEL